MTREEIMSALDQVCCIFDKATDQEVLMDYSLSHMSERVKGVNAYIRHRERLAMGWYQDQMNREADDG